MKKEKIEQSMGDQESCGFEVCVAILNRVIMVGFMETARFEQQCRIKKEGNEPCGYLGKKYHWRREHKISLHCEN